MKMIISNLIFIFISRVLNYSVLSRIGVRSLLCEKNGKIPRLLTSKTKKITFNEWRSP